jgi:hypothetical protein
MRLQHVPDGFRHVEVDVVVADEDFLLHASCSPESVLPYRGAAGNSREWWPAAAGVNPVGIAAGGGDRETVLPDGNVHRLRDLVDSCRNAM